MASAELGGRLRFADIRLVVGTRPEAIKLQPVARALTRRGLIPTVILTGQHALDPAEHGFDGLPIVALGCPGQFDAHRHARAVSQALLPLLHDAPDLLIVQGDTSSALGGALAGFEASIPIAHVEAGLRTHNRLPWPEEEFRVAIDARAELLFAPTTLSATNLAAERVAGEVHITGNTAIDAVLETARQLPALALRDRGSPRILVTCHRRESWRAGLRSIATAIAELASEGRAEFQVVLHPNPHVAATMERLLSPIRGVALLAPCPHADLLQLLRGADLVLSDSGGIQEEAPALGVPLLVLRDQTERPEGVAAGCSRLVGTDAARIVAEVRSLLDDPLTLAAMSCPAFPFGDGRSGERIAAIVARWLDERSLTRRLA